MSQGDVSHMLVAKARKLARKLPGPLKSILKRTMYREQPGHQHPVPIALNGNLEDSLLLFLDSPDSLPEDKTFPLSGWIASRRKILSFASPDILEHEFELSERPDVRSEHPGHEHIFGFAGTGSFAEIRKGFLTLRITVDGAEITFPWPIPMKDSRQQEYRERKLQKISKVLMCPETRMPLFDACGEPCDTESPYQSNFRENHDHFNFLPKEIRDSFSIVDTQNVSSHLYDGIANSLVAEYHDGLILDCGAGYRKIDYPNVVNFEIVPYSSTDVLGVNERLPFLDDSFDAVLSLNVLEHVKDPFVSAREIARVLKPGGTLYCVVPLLQPVHGYPHHYYNMTSQGLRNLFDQHLTVETQTVLPSGLPIYSLSWMLQSWADGLPEGPVRDSFLSLRIADLVNVEPASFRWNPFVSELSEEKNFELASATMVLARKPGGNQAEG